MKGLLWIMGSVMMLSGAARAAGPGASAEAGSGPSVLVAIEPIHRGSLPDIVSAYGSVEYDPGSITTLSLQQEGRVTHVAVTPGEAVSAGQTLIEFSRSARSVSRFDEARTALSLARQQHHHAARLMTLHLATRDQLAQADKAVQDAQSNFDTLQSEGAGRAAGIAAPFDGVVQSVPVSTGDSVLSGAPLLTLARGESLIVTAGIEPELRSRIRLGQDVSVVALRGSDTATGRLLRVGGQINPHTHLLDIAVSLPGNVMLSGEAVHLELTVGHAEGWLVPRQAVAQEAGAQQAALRNGQGLSVYQVANGHVVRIPVQLAAEQGEQDLISGKLDVAHPLVTTGVHQLTDGAAIRLRQ